MRSTFLTRSVLALSVVLLTFHAGAQSIMVSDPGIKKAYWTSSGEWIFSTPILDIKSVDANGNETSSDQGAVIRFSPFFNAQGMLNYDLSAHFGLFTGLSIRNQGFIWKSPIDSINVHYKYRTYNLGIPVGFKVGNMNRGLLFVGYEFELPFNYKEKEFINDDKDKFNVWFSDRTEPFFQSVFFGYQGPKSVTLTVRYYLTNFHNQDYEETQTINGTNVKVKPYDGFNVNILAVSLGYALFDGKKAYLHSGGGGGEPKAMR